MSLRLKAVVVPLLFALAAAGCRGGEEKQPPPPAGVTIVADPPPGTYRAYVLNVTISTAEPGAELFFDVNQDPEIADARAYRGPITVRMLASTSIRVALRDKRGRVWGPYAYEYQLKRDPNHADCVVSPPPRQYYKPTETLAVGLSFSIPSALAEVSLLLDDEPIDVPVSPSSPNQTLVADVGPVAGEGAHRLSCRVKSTEVTVIGNELAFYIDGTPPSYAWASAGGAFRRDTWPGSFAIDLVDAGSGIAAAQFCGTSECLPLTPLGGNRYLFASALTTGASSTDSFVVRATDLAGNLTVSSQLQIDLSSFAEADPPQLPAAITLTTETVADLTGLLGAPINEARTYTWSAVPPAAAPLAPGFNDFLVRRPGASVWESVSVYRAGVAVTLPASPSPWLIYAGNATVPAFEAARIDAVAADPSGAVWTRAVFDLPHLLFVNDLNANGRWDGADVLYTLAGEPWSERWRARAAPVVAAAIAQGAPAGATAQTVQIDCPADCPTPGVLVFERRAALASLPAAHEAVAVTAWPHALTVSVTPGELGVWYWDANADGVLNRFEARAWQPVTAAAVSLSVRDPRPFAYAQGRFVGLDYGGTVTGTAVIEIGGNPVQRRPAAALTDLDGLGSIAAQGRVQVPFYGAAGRFDFWSGTQTASQAFPVFTDPTAYPIFVAVSVTDETGAPVPALVSRLGDPAATRPSDMLGGLQFGVAALAPAPVLFAERDGYLSVARAVTSTTAPLRLLSPAVTQVLHGYVQDDQGQPVANTTVRWIAGEYRSSVVTAPDGYYSLPVSGGAGTLSVERESEFLAAVSFSLAVTMPSELFVAVVASAPAGTPWPLGLGTHGYPTAFFAAGPVTEYTNEYYYGVRADAGLDALTVNWDGLQRITRLPGALPAVTPAAYGSFLSPWNSGLVESRVECGAWFQRDTGAASSHAPCWLWSASDGYQKFMLGLLHPTTGFPAHVGLGEAFIVVKQAGAPAPDQELVFHERLLKQTLRVPVRGGLITAVLPYGRYDVTTQGGAPVVIAQTSVSVFDFTPAAPAPAALSIP